MERAESWPPDLEQTIAFSNRTVTGNYQFWWNGRDNSLCKREQWICSLYPKVGSATAQPLELVEWAHAVLGAMTEVICSQVPLSRLADGLSEEGEGKEPFPTPP